MAKNPNDRFIPRSAIGRAVDTARALLNRHLTAISVGVAAVGVALLLVGPGRALLAKHIDADDPGNPSDIMLLDGLAVGDGQTVLISDRLNRQMVPYTIVPDRPRDEVITYTVQPGDTVMSIAAAYGLDRTTVFWANVDTLQGDVHMLQPGMELYILPVDGVYHKSDGKLTLQAIADKYGVPVEGIINSEYNELEGATAADIPPWGVRLVVPGGTGEETDWRAPIIETVDETTGAVVRSFMPGMAGSCAAGITGSGGTGAWSIPILSGYTFTQPFWSGHSGVDLAAPIGTAVTAADSGVVIFSGWVDASWGYGVLVVLDHGNGWTTYYAHLSSNGVGCGQYVARGGYVGAVGSTGNSSGPHLHFEMRWNHVPDNPANHLGF